MAHLIALDAEMMMNLSVEYGFTIVRASRGKLRIVTGTAPEAGLQNSV
jgi:hypothetical protein